MDETRPALYGTRSTILVVIVNYRTAALTLKCLQSLSAEVQADGAIRVTVVENASMQMAQLESAVQVNGWTRWVRLIDAPRNGGFSYGNNLAIIAALASATPPDYVVLLNPDTETRGIAMRALADFMDARPEAGIGGSSIENEDGSLWPIAFRFPSAFSEIEQAMQFGPLTRLLRHVKIVHEMTSDSAVVDWVSGACMVIRRQVFDEIGMMDEGYFLYFEEIDFCRRAREKGWPCWYVQASRIMHLSGESTGASGSGNGGKRMPDYWFASRSRYFVKHHGVWYARLADLACIAGMAVWHARNALFQRRRQCRPMMLRDFLRTSVLFMRREAIERRTGIGHGA